MSCECLVIGDWQPAIWLDSNLEHGTAGSSNSFSNLPLTSQEFQVKDMECWALTRSPSLERGESRETESLSYRRGLDQCQADLSDGISGSPGIETKCGDEAGTVSGCSLVLEMMSLEETQRSDLSRPPNHLSSFFPLSPERSNCLHE